MELVAERRKDHAHGLRQDDPAQGLAAGEPERDCGFHLALVNGLDAGTERFPPGRRRSRRSWRSPLP